MRANGDLADLTLTSLAKAIVHLSQICSDIRMSHRYKLRHLGHSKNLSKILQKRVRFRHKFRDYAKRFITEDSKGQPIATVQQQSYEHRRVDDNNGNERGGAASVIVQPPEQSSISNGDIDEDTISVTVAAAVRPLIINFEDLPLSPLLPQLQRPLPPTPVSLLYDDTEGSSRTPAVEIDTAASSPITNMCTHISDELSKIMCDEAVDDCAVDINILLGEEFTNSPVTVINDNEKEENICTISTPSAALELHVATTAIDTDCTLPLQRQQSTILPLSAAADDTPLENVNDNDGDSDGDRNVVASCSVFDVHSNGDSGSKWGRTSEPIDEIVVGRAVTNTTCSYLSTIAALSCNVNVNRGVFASEHVFSVCLDCL